MSLQHLWSGFVRRVATAAGFVEQRAHHFHPGLLDRDSVVVDLGVHKGEFARFITGTYGCSVFGLEANPHLFAALPKLPRVQFMNLAIHRENAPLVFHLSENPEASSVFAEVAQAMGRLTPVEVTGVTLDSLLTRLGIASVALLKVDVESAEFQMLENIPPDTLAKLAQITVEFHVQSGSPEFSADRVRAICARLRRYGFRAFVMDREFTDVLFLKTGQLPWKFTERLAMLAYRRLIMPARSITSRPRARA